MFRVFCLCRHFGQFIVYCRFAFVVFVLFRFNLFHVIFVWIVCACVSVSISFFVVLASSIRIFFHFLCPLKEPKWCCFTVWWDFQWIKNFRQFDKIFRIFFICNGISLGIEYSVLFCARLVSIHIFCSKKFYFLAAFKLFSD